LHVSDGVLPHRLATDREEERRIFHVAVTRGQESVVVIGAADDPSPFLDELEGRRVTTGPAPVAAHVGLEFDEGGYTMEVLELTDDGVVATTPGGRARVTVGYGTTVRVDGEPRVLARPDPTAG